MSRNRFLLALMALCAGPSWPYDLNLVIAPPAQASLATCQSYTLAVALSMADISQRSPNWHIFTLEDLRRNEQTIRGAIERQMRKDLGRDLRSSDMSTREEWKSAIKAITFNEFDIENKTFTGLDDLFAFLKSNVAVSTMNNTIQSYTLQPPTRVFFTSFQQIQMKTLGGGENVSKYPGHIVSILGLDGGTAPRSEQPYLLLINSAARGDDHECLPLQAEKSKWFGTAGWTNNYTIRAFPGSPPYVLTWVRSNQAPLH